MTRTTHFAAILLGVGLFVSGPGWAADLPGTGADEGKTVVYRDTWGVPHIYAPTAEAGLYAMGWAQAEDRPDQLLQNFMAAIGEYASVVGRPALQSDIVARMWDHYGTVERNLDKIPDVVRGHVRAFAAGMNDFYAAHPSDTPAWWGDRKVDEAMVGAFSRLFLYNWSIDEAFGDLRRGGVQRGFERTQRGSNQWVVSPSRSAVDAAILYIDPHLGWMGVSRFWEFRIHAGDLHGSGFTLPGSPYVGLGHNRDLAWAMTTGGPDTADIFELTLKEGDPTRYLYDGEWREMTSKEVRLKVRGRDDHVETIWYSHQGPIVALRDGKAYAAAMAYADTVEVNQAWYEFNFAKDYKGAVAAMATLSLFPQNVMVADTSGNIYYQRTGRVPRRASGYDWSKPVDGSTSATAWQGVHPASDHLQVLNPPQGYMQNCNIPPDAMMVNSPFTMAEHLPYLFGSLDYGARSGWTSQRGARAVQLLHNDASVTIKEALAYAVDVHPYGVERWIDVLKAAHASFGGKFDSTEDYAAAIADLLGWDMQLRADSTGALKYYYWRLQLSKDLGREMMGAISGQIDQYYRIVEGRTADDAKISQTEMKAMLEAFVVAMANLKEDHGSLGARYGDKFRVGRDDTSFPLGGGGGRTGTTTLRNIGYGGERGDKTKWGGSGQTSTEIVVMTKPVQSWTYVPIGQSDRPDSPHYHDQAEKLFSKRMLKETWWLPENLVGHIESRTELKSAP